MSEDELKQAVSARLGRDPFVDAGQGEIAVDGRELPASAGQRRARIVQRDREGRVLGTRELEATSCEELRRSATFVVFLIVDPDAALGGSPISSPHPEAKDEQGEAQTEEPPRAKVEETRPPPKGPIASGRGASVSSTRAAPPPRVDLGLALVLSNGLLPKPDVGPALALGLEPLDLPIRFEWRASYRLATHAAAGYDFRAVEQEWRACYVGRVLGAAFGKACGGAAWTAILPEAHGLAGGDQAPKTLFSPTLAVGPALDVDGTRLFADLALAFPRPRYAFTYRDEGRAMLLHEVSRMVWSIGIGAATSFR